MNTISPGPSPSTPASNGPEWYCDVTSGSGLEFTYHNSEEAGQFTILESLGGGVALLDYDGDGLLDVFVTGGGSFDGPQKNQIRGLPCRLYKNLGGWKFRDVSSEVGFSGISWWYTHGAAVADYDRDGWPDLLVTGYGRVALFHNEAGGNGSRRFVDVSDKLGVHLNSMATSAGWGDIDGDGYPDVYVCTYCDWSFQNHPLCAGQRSGVARDVCPPERFKPLVHALFKNEAGKSFRDISSEHGFQPVGAGLGVVLVDLNDDRKPDIYVGNDGANNLLFMNRGGRLEEVGLAAGVAVDEDGTYDGSMGVDAADYDGSGRASLWVTNFQAGLHALYRNRGKESFQHITRASGIAAIGQHYVGFGTAFLDADADTWEDLVIANGHVLQFPSLGSTYKQLPVLLQNIDHDGRRFFRDRSSTAGSYFRTPVVGRGLAVGDLDNDGWPDLVVSHTNSPVKLLRNVVAEHAPKNWVGLKLIGKQNRDLVGSTVSVQVGERVLTRFVKGGGSYLSASDTRLLFGLAEQGKPGTVTVKWSWGGIQNWQGLESGSYWELREGEAAPRKLTYPH